MTRRRSLQREMIGMVVAGLVPLIGVLFFGWRVDSALFLITVEVILLSAMLGWLFNYPERSTVLAIVFVLVLAPAGFLMLRVLAGMYPGPLRSMGETVRELLSVTWVGVTVIAVRAFLFFRNALEKARRTGPSIERNDGILLAWIVNVFWPFAVFAMVAGALKSLEGTSLAAILALKTSADVGLFRWEHRRGLKKDSEGPGASST